MTTRWKLVYQFMLIVLDYIRRKPDLNPKTAVEIAGLMGKIEYHMNDDETVT